MTRIRTRRVAYTPSLSSVGPSSHEERGGAGRSGSGPRDACPAPPFGPCPGRKGGNGFLSWDREWGGGQRIGALPVTRVPPGGFFPRLAHRVPRVIHPRRGRGNGAAPGDGFRSEERILGVRDACGEGRKGAKKAREAFYPIARRCLFGQRASRVGNLPSEEKKVVCPAVALGFFRQKSNLGLDARHEKRGKGHMANQLSRFDRERPLLRRICPAGDPHSVGSAN